MPEVEGQEKTEKATPKKITDSREEGRVARSVEINSFMIFTTGLLLLYVTKSFLSDQFSTLARRTFGTLDLVSINLSNYSLLINQLIYFFLLTLAPVFITLLVIALASSFLQVGFKLSPKALAPKFNKLNPGKGIKNIF